MLKLIPFVSSAQLRELDSRASREFEIPAEELMENAGKRVSEFALGAFGKKERFMVLCGKGNNGGDGFACARRLKEAGAKVRVVLAEGRERLSGLPKKKLGEAEAGGVRIEVFSGNKDLLEREEKVIIDALLGYGLSGNPKGNYARLIRAANSEREKGAKVVAVDVPSGLDSDSGRPYRPCIQADFTVCFGLPKEGFTEGAREFTGRVFLADIGFPEGVYAAFGASREFVFGKGRIVEIEPV